MTASRWRARSAARSPSGFRYLCTVRGGRALARETKPVGHPPWRIRTAWGSHGSRLPARLRAGVTPPHRRSLGDWCADAAHCVQRQPCDHPSRGWPSTSPGPSASRPVVCPFVKALGLALQDRRTVQVSMNLTNYQQTSIRQAFDTVRQEAERTGRERARERDHRACAGSGSRRTDRRCHHAAGRLARQDSRTTESRPRRALLLPPGAPAQCRRRASSGTGCCVQRQGLPPCGTCFPAVRRASSGSGRARTGHGLREG